MSAAIDLTGQRFGHLTAVRKIAVTERGSALWECLCKCGKKRNVTTGDLRAGRKVSCGCQPQRLKAWIPLPHDHRLNQRMPWPTDYFRIEPRGLAPTAWWELPERGIARRVTKRKVSAG